MTFKKHGKETTEHASIRLNRVCATKKLVAGNPAAARHTTMAGLLDPMKISIVLKEGLD
jgi:hypothetical protein